MNAFCRLYWRYTNWKSARAYAKLKRKYRHER